MMSDLSTAAGEIEDRPRLSICLATYMRARFIGETLDSLVAQMEPSVEILVVDGASLDDTAAVMAQYVERWPFIRYHRECVNSGIDRDYDKAVSYASGDYCWLMTDDDLLAPGAVRTLLDALVGEPDLVILNSEVSNADYSSMLTARFIRAHKDTCYRPEDRDALFATTAGALSFIGCVVIRRKLWLTRFREPYFGTLFVHVGVIFQQPAIENVLVIAKPMVAIRYGNAMWTARGFEIWMFKWPALIWSFDHIADRSRMTVSVPEPWRQFRKLLLYRAIGGFGMDEYRRFIVGRTRRHQRLLPFLLAAVPSRFANALAGLYCLLFARSARTNLYDLARSANSSWVSRLSARILGVIET
jgi:abequosyltransferase